MSFFKVLEQDLESFANTFASLPQDFKDALPWFATFASKTAPLVETGLALSGNGAAAAATQAVVSALDASVNSTPTATKDALPSTLQTAASLAHAVGASALADHITNVANAVALSSPTVSTSVTAVPAQP